MGIISPHSALEAILRASQHRSLYISHATGDIHCHDCRLVVFSGFLDKGFVSECPVVQREMEIEEAQRAAEAAGEYAVCMTEEECRNE